MDPLGHADQPAPPPPGDAPGGPGARDRALTGFLALYGAGRFFDAHEALETVWRRQPDDPVMALLHGLIQWAVAFEHHRRGNPRGARVLLARAWSRLASPGGAERDLGLDLSEVRGAHPAIHAAFAAWDAGASRPDVVAPPIRRTAGAGDGER
jgi:uncharacterized protein